MATPIIQSDELNLILHNPFQRQWNGTIAVPMEADGTSLMIRASCSITKSPAHLVSQEVWRLAAYLDWESKLIPMNFKNSDSSALFQEFKETAEAVSTNTRKFHMHDTKEEGFLGIFNNACAISGNGQKFIIPADFSRLSRAFHLGTHGALVEITCDPKTMSSDISVTNSVSFPPSHHKPIKL